MSLSDTMDRSQPDSSVREIPQAKHWSSLPFSISGDLPDPGIEPTDPGPPESPAVAGGFLTTEPPGKIPPRYKMSGANTLKEQE